MKKGITLSKTWTDGELVARRALSADELQHRLELNRIAAAANGDGARRNRRAERSRRLARGKAGRHDD
ncbi:hypothetical protein LWF15_01365 [Kineosporia rhizophila]|uniref:hypothetical protein n=1 Tax=Kineosporia TaxID=49184 RepID=UPI001E60BEFE|nr:MULTISPECIES: hypothetical protein [Kineosporia]MCE0534147.1 hypothetical protein [Kineosporia rhizophila]GLY13693.1 hypothetical protein Kisp01_07090 [Kineosporia sp. NBRC 101677]